MFLELGPTGATSVGDSGGKITHGAMNQSPVRSTGGGECVRETPAAVICMK